MLDISKNTCHKKQKTRLSLTSSNEFHLAARVQVRLNYCHIKLLPSVLECFNL